MEISNQLIILMSMELFDLMNERKMKQEKISIINNNIEKTEVKNNFNEEEYKNTLNKATNLIQHTSDELENIIYKIQNKLSSIIF